MNLAELMPLLDVESQRVKSRSGGWSSIIITHEGKTQHLHEWAEETGIPYSTLHKRYKRGLDPDQILHTGKITPTNQKDLTYNGKTQSISKWSKEIGVSVPTIYKRIQVGKPIEQILYPGNLSTARKQAKHYWNRT